MEFVTPIGRDVSPLRSSSLKKPGGRPGDEDVDESPLGVMMEGVPDEGVG